MSCSLSAFNKIKYLSIIVHKFCTMWSKYAVVFSIKNIGIRLKESEVEIVDGREKDDESEYEGKEAMGEQLGFGSGFGNQVEIETAEVMKG